MKALNLIRLFTLSIGVFGMMIIFSSANGQEVDDMYFNKSDRTTVKAEKVVAVTNQNAKTSNIENKNITKTTAEYSSKNINPEYIARYKSTEANEVKEPVLQENDEYSSKDYFVENYDNSEYVSDPNKNEINYAALNKRDQMSTSNYSNYNRPYSSPSWRFSPYMSMGMGMGFGGYPYGGYGYNPYMMGYDPFMMGYGSGMSMGFGFGSGFGYGSAMSYSLAMSYGTGYNPWGGWGRYPGYSPYGMGGFYDPWGPSYGYNPYRNNFASYYGGGCPMGIYNSSLYNGSRYGGTVLTTSANRSDYVNGRNVSYKARTTRSATTSNPRYTRTSTASERVRVSSNSDRVRVPVRDVSTSAAVSNGRISSRDYGASQNEKVQRYTNASRRNASSYNTSANQRILSGSTSRNTYRRGTATSTSRFNSASYSNKPVRGSGYTSGYSRSSTSRSTSFTGRSSSGSSSYSPSRSSSSSGSSFGRSYSSGSRSYSSGGSSGSSSGGGGSRSAGRSGGRN